MIYTIFDMDIVDKIDKIRIQKGWSVNRLASEAMLTQSTVSNMFNSHAEPKLSTLRAILEAFDMTLTEFFQEDDSQNINARSLELISLYNTLDDVEKKAVLELVRTLSKKR